jgi:hypothetical protein
MSSADAGFAAIDAPLAFPSHYFEVPFTATANTPYHVWVRLRGTANSKWNDAVWVQFNDAVTTNNVAVYRTGTASGLLVNLEPCGGCGMSGWGWQDGAWWLTQPKVVQFLSTGTHTIRVQTREDGVQVDQIVLSPATYLTARPGELANDTTIEKSSTETSILSIAEPVTLAAAAATTPYSGTPLAIPGTVEAEYFDNGGEGNAYHDSSPGNAGGAFRSSDVDLQVASGGGFNIGWVTAGEWTRYAVTVKTAGTYTVRVRVAASGQGGTFHLEMNGSNVTGPLAVPNTGGWQNWQTVSKAIALNAGVQSLRLIADTTGAGAVGNFDSIQFTLTAGTVAASPFSGTPTAIPGTVQAEAFDNGSAGVAYQDSTAGNAGGAFRASDVDVQASAGGGYNVGWTAAGEWLQYTVNVATAGSYTAQLRVAATAAGSRIHLEMNGTNVTGAMTVPNTGGWHNWQTISQPITLAAGPQVARLVFETAGSNLDSFQILSVVATPPPPTGATISVPAGGNLQAAIDSARPGDTILLTPGATYIGAFVLPVKSGASYITIRSGAPASALPAEGVRVGPQHAPQLAKIQGGFAGAPAFVTAHGAHHWRLQWLEIVDTWAHGNIIEFGDGSARQNTLASVARDLVIDRCYIHGHPTNGQKRGIALNSGTTSIINSYISDIKSSEEDSQAIAGWNGPGPYTIVNNYLEAAGENFLLGGADPAILNLVPSDIVFRHNHVKKQPSWRNQAWTVKNLIELKNAQRVVIDGNILEYNWAAAQTGYAVVLTPRNQDGRSPWSVVQQVQITNNLIRHVAAVFKVLGTDDIHPSRPLNDITIRNNLALGVSRTAWGGNGQFLITLGGSNIKVDHNTVFTDGTSVLYADGPSVSGFVFTNNIVPDNLWAVMGGGASPGNGTIAKFYPGSTFLKNVFIGSSAATYPAGNFYPATIAQVGFIDPAGNYRLSATSPYVSAATDGTAVGANIPAINSAAGTQY